MIQFYEEPIPIVFT